MSNFEDVKTFMKTFGQEIKIKAEFPNEKIVKLRHNLIHEELNELQQRNTITNICRYGQTTSG